MDHRQWLRPGAAAAQALRCSQPTASRRLATLLNPLRSRLRRQGGACLIRGHLERLASQQQVHQIWCLRG